MDIQNTLDVVVTALDRLASGESFDQVVESTGVTSLVHEARIALRSPGRVPPPLITILEGPKVVRPANSIGGLYLHLLSHNGRLTSDQILEFCATIASDEGWNPDGRGTIGGPTQHGLKSITYAVWFYDRLRKDAKASS